jgi:DNA polymerase I
MTPLVIPPDINVWPRKKQVEYYVDQLGWIIHPVIGPKVPVGGKVTHPGKQPCLAEEERIAWSQSKAVAHFSNGTPDNVGQAPQAPNVGFDVDPETPEALRRFFDEFHEFSACPYVRSGDGIHIHGFCPDVPAGVKKVKRINFRRGLNVEFFAHPSTNLILPPSIHPQTGKPYVWVNSGPLPIMGWSKIQENFGFPVDAHQERASLEWMETFTGDLRTLDVPALCKELDIYLEDIGPLDKEPDTRRHAIRCLWADEHTMHGGQTETVLFVTPGKVARLSCLHAHCGTRRIKDFFQAAQKKVPGIVDRHCAKRYAKEAEVAAEGSERVEEERRPLPPVDWLAAAKRVERHNPSHEHALYYPQDSILEEFLEVGLSLGEGSPCFHLAAVLSVVASLLARRVWTPWFDGAVLYPNVYILVVAPPALRKSSSFKLATRIANACLSHNALMPDRCSKESLFEQYYEPAGGCPDQLWIAEDGNDVLNEWRKSPTGEGVAATLLRLFDCCTLSESYMRNKEGNEQNPKRIVPITCTSVLMGATYNVACFQDTTVRTGMASRFLYYLAESLGRPVYLPNDSGVVDDLINRFRPLLGLSGKVTLSPAAKKLWVDYQARNRQQLLRADRFAEALRGRLGRCPTLVMKTAMHFEACRLVCRGSGLQQIEEKTLELAIWNVNEHMRSAAYLEQVVDGHTTGDNAEVILATIRKDFRSVGGTIYLDRTDLTRKFCHNSGRKGSLSASDLYVKVIPALIAQGDAALVRKEGKYELYGFRVENPDGYPENSREDDAPDSPLSTPPPSPWSPSSSISPSSSGGNTPEVQSVSPLNEGSRKESEENGENKGDTYGRVFPESAIPPEENGENGENGHCPEVINGPQKAPGGTNLTNLPQEPAETIEPKGQEGSAQTAPEPPSKNFLLVDTREALASVWPRLTQGGEATIALDLETAGDYQRDALDWKRGDVRLLSVALPNDDPVLFDLKALGYDAANWSELVKGREVIGHYFRFDMMWLADKLGVHLPRVYCTWSASKILTNGDRISNSLKDVLKRHLGVKVCKDHQLSDFGGMFLTECQYRYAAADVAHLHALREKLTEALHEAGLWKTFALEMKLLLTVVRMQAAGVPILREKLEGMLEELTRARKESEQALKPHLGQWVNFDSVDQVETAFESIGVDLENTRDETLQACEHPAAALLRAYRAPTKACQKAHELLDALSPDGRIHGEFDPLGAETGRFSAENPNLQNVPRGPMRACFAPLEADRVFVVCDYGQIELRMGAFFAQDQAMLKAFREGQDLHYLTAATVLNKPVDAVTREERQLAKAVNFGLLYGQSAGGLVNYARAEYGVEMSTEQAETIRGAFFAHYRGLAKWHRDAHRQADKITEGRTIIGRRRLRGRDASHQDKFQALTNLPAQGSAADGLKLAMVYLDAKLPPGAQMVSTVHDELLIECAEAQADQVLALVKSETKGAFAKLFKNLPIEVEAKICRNWGDK